jgi:hypothetical protein
MFIPLSSIASNFFTWRDLPVGVSGRDSGSRFSDSVEFMRRMDRVTDEK